MAEKRPLDIASSVRAKLQRPSPAAQRLAGLIGGSAEDAPQVVSAQTVQAAADRWGLAPPPEAASARSGLKRPGSMMLAPTRPSGAVRSVWDRAPTATASAFLTPAFAAPAADPAPARTEAESEPPPPPPPRSFHELRTTMSQAALGPGEEALAAAPASSAASAASRFAGLVPTSVRRRKVESGRGQDDGKRHRALDGREGGASTGAADGADASEAGGASSADADAPLWRTLAVHDACEASIGGKWRAVAVVGVTHKGYEVARYRVRTAAAAATSTTGQNVEEGLIDVHEVSSAEVRRFRDATAAASRAPPDTPECTFFARDGFCKRGAKCKFLHVGVPADRPSAAEVEAAIAAAASDRAAAAASSGAVSAQFFPENAETRAARDADAFLQGLRGPSGTVGGVNGDDDDDERLAQQRLEEEMAEREKLARPGRPGGGTYSLQALHPG